MPGTGTKPNELPPAAILLSFVGPALVLVLCFNALARRAGLRARGLTWRIVLTLLAAGILIAPMRGLPLARWLAGVADHWSVPLLALLVWPSRINFSGWNCCAPG